MRILPRLERIIRATAAARTTRVTVRAISTTYNTANAATRIAASRLSLANPTQRLLSTRTAANTAKQKPQTPSLKQNSPHENNNSSSGKLPKGFAAVCVLTGIFATCDLAGADTKEITDEKIPHTEIVHENAKFLARREGDDLKFYIKNKGCVFILNPFEYEDVEHIFKLYKKADGEVLSFKIFGHDNRLESTRIDFDNFKDSEKNEFINFLKEVLKEKICGKAFILKAKEDDKATFIAAGFSFKPLETANAKRVATNNADVLIQIKASLPKNFKFQPNINPSQYSQRLMELAEKSGFLKEKVKDYKKKGMAGLKAMQIKDVTRPAIFDETGKLVACCTVSCPADGRDAYFADTWVDENAFGGSKEKGTKILYKSAAATLPKGRTVNVIMPPDREEEFGRLGFTSPTNIGVLFQAPGPHLGRTFAWQKQEVHRPSEVNTTAGPPAPRLACK